MATGAKPVTRTPATGRSGQGLTRKTVAALLTGTLVLGGTIGYTVGWKKHTHHPAGPFQGTISRVDLNGVGVCVTPAAGGTDICDPLYRVSGSPKPVVGDKGWFNYSYDTRGPDGFVLLVETRNG